MTLEKLHKRDNVQVLTDLAYSNLPFSVCFKDQLTGEVVRVYKGVRIKQEGRRHSNDDLKWKVIFPEDIDNFKNASLTLELSDLALAKDLDDGSIAIAVRIDASKIGEDTLSSLALQITPQKDVPSPGQVLELRGVRQFRSLRIPVDLALDDVIDSDLSDTKDLAKLVEKSADEMERREAKKYIELTFVPEEVTTSQAVVSEIQSRFRRAMDWLHLHW